MLLAFDCRAEIEPGYEGAYIAISFFADGKQVAWTSAPFTARWQSVLVPIASLRVPKDFTLKPGAEFS